MKARDVKEGDMLCFPKGESKEMDRIMFTLYTVMKVDRVIKLTDGSICFNGVECSREAYGKEETLHENERALATKRFRPEEDLVTFDDMMRANKLVAKMIEDNVIFCSEEGDVKIEQIGALDDDS
jgi:hypothetical protein